MELRGIDIKNFRQASAYIMECLERIVKLEDQVEELKTKERRDRND